MTAATFPVSSTQLVILDHLHACCRAGDHGAAVSACYGWHLGLAGLAATIRQRDAAALLRELRVQEASLVHRHQWAAAVHALRRKLERAL